MFNLPLDNNAKLNSDMRKNLLLIVDDAFRNKESCLTYPPQ